MFTASKKGDPKAPQAEEQAREDSVDVVGKICASPCCLPYHLGFQLSHCPLLSVTKRDFCRAGDRQC